MNSKIILGIVVLGVIISGSIAFADVFPNVTSNGSLVVNNGNFQFTRTDNKQTQMVLTNNDKQSAFNFNDADDLQTYLMRSTPGANGQFQFLDFSGASPVERVDINIVKSTGKIGIGTTTPTEKLDVNGNLRVHGNIVSSGDICIGTCP